MNKPLKKYFVRQRYSKECGAACLAMICRYWGSDISLSEISEICVSDKAGVSMLAISKTAQSLGLEARGVKLSIDSLKNSPLPCILHWKQDHFVVLYNCHKNSKNSIARFKILDPAKGILTIDEKDLIKYWTIDNLCGYAMFFHPNDNFKIITDNHIKHTGLRTHIITFFSKYKNFSYLILGGLLFTTLLQLALPFLTKAVVDIGIKNSDINLILLILAGEFSIFFSQTLTDVYRKWITLKISTKINLSNIGQFFIKLLGLPMQYFENKITGDIILRISDNNRIKDFITTQMMNAIMSLFTIIVFGIVLLIFQIQIFFIYMIGSIAYIIWNLIFLNKRKILDYEIFELQAIGQNKTYQFVSSLNEVKLQNCGRRRQKEWEKSQIDIFNTQIKAYKLQKIEESGGVIINQLKNMLITAITAYSVVCNDLSLGNMVAIQFIIGQIESPLMQLTSFIYSYQDVTIAINRINEVAESKSEKELYGCIQDLNNNFSITINDLYFKYSQFDLNNVLSKINIKIPQGKITAIVGASGSGKSTLIKILLGYYPNYKGHIKIGNTNLKDLDVNFWRQQCGVVMQDGIIFSDSIAGNVAIDDMGINMEKVIEACEIAGVSQFIQKLPNSYNTQIGPDGIGLSKGQKQRILIARAIYKNAPFLILDEATNSLDTENEMRITNNLNMLSKGKTVIIIAHRLSTIRNADQIIIMEKGEIAEIGTHNELLQAKGKYYELVKSQL